MLELIVHVIPFVGFAFLKKTADEFIVFPPVQRARSLPMGQWAEIASARGRASEERPRRWRIRHE